VQAIRWNPVTNKNHCTTPMNWFSLNMYNNKEGEKLIFYWYNSLKVISLWRTLTIFLTNELVAQCL
jgi:hypothetical protein